MRRVCDITGSKIPGIELQAGNFILRLIFRPSTTQPSIHRNQAMVGRWMRSGVGFGEGHTGDMNNATIKRVELFYI